MAFVAKSWKKTTNYKYKSPLPEKEAGIIFYWDLTPTPLTSSAFGTFSFKEKEIGF